MNDKLGANSVMTSCLLVETPGLGAIRLDDKGDILELRDGRL